MGTLSSHAPPPDTLGGPDDVSRRELLRLAIHGLRQSSLSALCTIPLGVATEWLLRPYGFGSANLGPGAVRVALVLGLVLAVHLAVRFRGHNMRHPFLVGTFLMWVVAVLGGFSAADTGGFDSPYQVAVVPILLTWTLLMPGGYRFAMAPLLGGVLIYLGVLFALSPAPRSVGGAIASTFFQLASMSVAVVFCEVLERWRVRVARASYTDALTGLMSRGYLLDRLTQLVHHRKRRHASIAVLLVDLDHFKAVNDTHGHAVGDAVLCMVADVLRTHTRAEDLCGRLGGEEFLLVLDECDEERAVLVANRVREQVGKTPVVSNGRTVRVTLSCGITVAPPGRTEHPDALIRSADEALYLCKRSGRNQVRVSELRSSVP